MRRERFRRGPVARLSRARRLRAVLGLLLFSLASCEGEAPKIAAPSIETGPIATLAVEPSQMRIGEISAVEILVATAPGHRLLPLSPPKLEEIWILDQHTPPVERLEDRWLHRLLFRIRPQQLGIHAWPETEVQIESEDGERVSIPVPGRELEVVSVIPQMEVRGSPFGMLAPDPPPPTSGMSTVVAAALGAAGALLLVLALRLASMRARPRTEIDEGSEVTSEATIDLFAWAEAEIDRALETLASDPRCAANRGARTLRRYVERRFEAATRPLTTPELANAEPPLKVYSRWPHFLRILRVLDDTRFRSGAPDAELQSEVRSALEEVRSFVADSKPRGAS